MDKVCLFELVVAVLVRFHAQLRHNSRDKHSKQHALWDIAALKEQVASGLAYHLKRETKKVGAALQAAGLRKYTHEEKHSTSS